MILNTIYDKMVLHHKSYLDLSAQFLKKVSDFFALNDLGVTCYLQENDILVIEFKSRVHVSKAGNIVYFYDVLTHFCNENNMKIVYKEHRTWDRCINIPPFSKEIIYLERCNNE